MTSYSCSATPISYKGDEISRLSRSIFEILRGTDRRQTETGRQTDDTRDDQNIRLLHLQCANLNNVFLKTMNYSTIMLVTYSQESCTRNLYKSTCTRYKKLDCVSCFLVRVFFLYKNLASNTTELHSTQETCRHVTKIERCDRLVCRLLTICCFDVRACV